MGCEVPWLRWSYPVTCCDSSDAESGGSIKDELLECLSDYQLFKDSAVETYSAYRQKRTNYQVQEKGKENKNRKMEERKKGRQMARSL
jgi:hypothetical protein